MKQRFQWITMSCLSFILFLVPPGFSVQAAVPIHSGESLNGDIGASDFMEKWALDGTIGARVLITAVKTEGLAQAPCWGGT